VTSRIVSEVRDALTQFQINKILKFMIGNWNECKFSRQWMLKIKNSIFKRQAIIFLRFSVMKMICCNLVYVKTILISLFRNILPPLGRRGSNKLFIKNRFNKDFVLKKKTIKLLFLQKKTCNIYLHSVEK
jgi:hypothetical protein